jgi:hypothetical protein
MKQTTAQTHSTSRNEFIRKMFEEENIIDLLTMIGLPGLKVVKDEEKNHDFNLSSIKFHLHRDDEDRKSKMLIQVTTGEPTLDMLYDAVYGFGSDCRGRMILFSEGSDDSINRDMVEKMIDGLNRFGMGIWLCKVEFGPKGLACRTIVQPTGSYIFCEIDAPSREQFTEAEFWLRYYGLEDSFDDPEEWACDFNTEFGEWIWLNGLEVAVHWNEEGAIFYAREILPENEYTRKIWDRHMRHLTEVFKGCEVKYSVVAGKMPEITVNLWRNPISDLIGSTSAEKKAYGDLLYARFHRFSEMMEDFVWDLNNGEKMKAVCG